MEFSKPSGETPTEGGNAVSAAVFCQSELWIAHKLWPGWNNQRKAGQKWMNDWIVWDSNALLSSQVFLQRRHSRAWVLSTSAGYKLQIDYSSRSHGSTMLREDYKTMKDPKLHPRGKYTFILKRITKDGRQSIANSLQALTGLPKLHCSLICKWLKG